MYPCPDLFLAYVMKNLSIDNLQICLLSIEESAFFRLCNNFILRQIGLAATRVIIRGVEELLILVVWGCRIGQYLLPEHSSYREGH